MPEAPPPSEPSASPTSSGLVVLGMHRSGTSMLSHLLGALGHSFGGELVGAAPDNPLGFWEHAGIVTAHDTFLALRGRSWSDPRRLAPDDFRSPEAAASRRRLEALFERDLAPHERWVVKDPRMCRLLPLWSEILDDPRADIGFLHLVRDPLAVAASLAVRDDFPTARSLLLWLRHNLEAEAATRGRPRAWIRFEELVARPVEVLEAALGRIGWGDLFPGRALEEAAGEVIEPGAVHHRVGGGAELADDFPWVDRAQAAIGRLLEGESEEAGAVLDELDAAMESAERQLLRLGPAQDGGEGAVEAGERRFARELGRLEAQGRRLERVVEAVGGLPQHIGESSQALREAGRRVSELGSGLSRAESEARSRLDRLSGAVESLVETSELYRRSLSLLNSTERRLLGKSLKLLEEVEERHLEEKRSWEAEDEARREEEARLVAERDRLAAELSELAAERAEVAAERGALADEVARERRRAEELEAAVGSIVSSRSWRVTRPLRGFLEWLRGPSEGRT